MLQQITCGLQARTGEKKELQELHEERKVKRRAEELQSQSIVQEFISIVPLRCILFESSSLCLHVKDHMADNFLCCGALVVEDESIAGFPNVQEE